MSERHPLLSLVTQYRAGLEAETALLQHLRALAERERESTATGSTDELEAISDSRSRLMASLVEIEAEVKPLRRTLAAAQHTLADSRALKEVTALHQQAAELVEAIVSNDQRLVTAMRAADSARRLALKSLETAETTLAGYKRVVMPTLASAALVNRRG